MNERAEKILTAIENYLDGKRSQSLSADFYFFVSRKNTLPDDFSFRLENFKKENVLEYLLVLYESNLFIKDISTIESQLLADFENEIKSENLYFIEGATSILYYFILTNHLEKQSLTEKLAEKVNQILESIDRLYGGQEFSEFEIVLGFEGLAGAIKVLSKSEDPSIQSILRKGLRFFGEFKNPGIDFKKGDYAMFPRMLRTDGNKMKYINSDWLSWSVGDLGIATATNQVANQNRDDDLNRTAQLIGFNSILRKDEKNTLINQPFFKTGSAGLAYTYQYFYQQTGVELFRQSYEFWIEKTLDFVEKLIEDKLFFDDLSILNGVTGVAFVLDSYINDKAFCHDFLMAD